MMEYPELWVERICKAGASGITFHLEATLDPFSIIHRIKKYNPEIICGVAIKPETLISSISDELLSEIDMVLVMTVEPGFGGQTLIKSCIEKVKELKFSRAFSKLIQVDGGVDESNVRDLKEAGANVIVAGSSLFKATDPKSVIMSFKN